MFTKDTLKDKSFLITGGSGGLGLGMAKGFAELGANVAICGRTEENLQKAAKELKPFGTKVATFAVDVSNYEAVGTMMEQAVSELGGLNGLVNNAGANFLCFSEELSPNGFKAIVNIVPFGADILSLIDFGMTACPRSPRVVNCMFMLNLRIE